MSKQYDVIVIGAGTAAMGVANRVRRSGKTVAIIDFRPYGGTCALRGCDPKKMLISGAEAVESVHRMKGRGAKGDVQIDWTELISFKRSFTDPVPEKHEKRYQKKGIDTYHGTARFTGPDSVEVNGTQLKAQYIVIASGAEPRRLSIPGEELLVTNEDFLSMERLPKRIVLVGGGYVAAEFSHIAARAGAEVTILQRGETMLTHFDSDLVAWLMEKFQALGIDVRTNSSVKAIQKDGDSFQVKTSTREGEKTFEADLVVHSAGRVPALEALNLEAAGIETTEKGRVKLNEFLQSVSNPHIYVAGDAAQQGPPLTPVSSHDAKVVVANILEGNHRSPNYKGVPSVAFTLPPIAMVGLTEDEAKKKGLKFRMKCEKASDWYTARRVAENIYGFKVLVEESTDQILGAHLVGPQVDEVINLFGLAIQKGLTAEDIKTTMFAYPTGASDIGYMV